MSSCIVNTLPSSVEGGYRAQELVCKPWVCGAQEAEQRAAMVQQRAEHVRKEVNPLNHPLVQKYFQR